MLSTPCWFIKLIPAQAEAGLVTDHVARKGARQGTLGHSCISKASFILNDINSVILREAEIENKVRKYTAPVRMCGKHSSLDMVIGRRNWQDIQQKVAGRYREARVERNPASYRYIHGDHNSVSMRLYWDSRVSHQENN